MKKLLIAATALTLLASPMAMAQPDRHDDHRGDMMRGNDDHRGDMMQRNDDHRGGPGMMMNGGGRHEWRRGDRFDRNEWNRYDRVDYRRYHLRQPPRGYEWRRVDNNYVLAAVATGVIASIIASH